MKLPYKITDNDGDSIEVRHYTNGCTLLEMRGSDSEVSPSSVLVELDPEDVKQLRKALKLALPVVRDEYSTPVSRSEK
jgi:hypothetical protein